MQEAINTARKIKSFDYNDTFPRRFRELLDERKDITQDRVAELVGVTRQTVGNWCSGKSAPDAVSLARIADEFDVSIDWLLNEKAPKKIDADLKAVCEYTGLSETAVWALHETTIRESKTFLRDSKKRSEKNLEVLEVLSDFIYKIASPAPSYSFLGNILDAVRHYNKSCKILENAEKLNRGKKIAAMEEAEKIYECYQVDAFWCQKSVTDWLDFFVTEQSNYKVYALLFGKIMESMEEDISGVFNKVHVKQKGVSNGEHPETNE